MKPLTKTQRWLALSASLALIAAFVAITLPPIQQVLLQPSTAAIALRPGDRGNPIQQVQQKLSNWGYYHGSIDGVFGSQTDAAV